MRCSPLNAALYLLEILVKIKNVFAILLIVYLILIAVWYFVMVVVNDYALSTLNSDWGAFWVICWRCTISYIFLGFCSFCN